MRTYKIARAAAVRPNNTRGGPKLVGRADPAPDSKVMVGRELSCGSCSVVLNVHRTILGVMAIMAVQHQFFMEFTVKIPTTRAAAIPLWQRSGVQRVLFQLLQRVERLHHKTLSQIHMFGNQYN